MIQFRSKRYFRHERRGIGFAGAVAAAAISASVMGLSAFATTANLGLALPTVGADSTTWGDKLNTALTAIDAQFVNIGTTVFGTAATKNTGTSGATVPLLSTANTWALAQTFSSGITANVTGNLTGTASAVDNGVVTPSKLSTGVHPSWDSNNSYPLSTNLNLYYQVNTGNGHTRLYFSATDFIEFDEANHQVKFVLSGAQKGHVDPVSGFVND